MFTATSNIASMTASIRNGLQHRSRPTPICKRLFRGSSSSAHLNGNSHDDAPVPADHETKYTLPNCRAHVTLQWLKRRCRPDPIYPCAIISSIYYDTRDWRLLREKQDSDYYKTKVRLRWYSNIADGTPQGDSYIEAKFREGSRRRKVRIKTAHPAAWLNRVSLNTPALMSIPSILRHASVLLPADLRPALVVRYKRYRFVDPISGARLALDYDIEIPRVNVQMGCRQRRSRLGDAVFEFKGGASALPGPLQQLTAMGCRKTSFSKYALCCENIMA